MKKHYDSCSPPVANSDSQENGEFKPLSGISGRSTLKSNLVGDLVASSPPNHEFVQPTELAPVHTGENAGDDAGHERKRNLRQRRASGAGVDDQLSMARTSIPASILSDRSRGFVAKRLRKPVKVIAICGLCLGSQELNNRTGTPEELIACWECGRAGHPSCLKMPSDLVARIKLLRWRCVDCKRCCLCQSAPKSPKLNDSNSTDKDLLLCDSCDRGFHLFCLEPRLSEPPEGTWICPICCRSSAHQSSTEMPSSDPRLDAISLCDHLTQHEIDWMQGELNSSCVNSPTTCSPSPTDSTRKSSTGSRGRRPSKGSLGSVDLASSPHQSAENPVIPATAIQSPRTDEGNMPSASAVKKVQKRLVQKSLASWTVPQSPLGNTAVKPSTRTVSTSKASPTTASAAAEGNKSDMDSAPSTSTPKITRPRRTSAVASLVWQSLLKRKTQHRKMNNFIKKLSGESAEEKTGSSILSPSQRSSPHVSGVRRSRRPQIPKLRLRTLKRCAPVSSTDVAASKQLKERSDSHMDSFVVRSPTSRSGRIPIAYISRIKRSSSRSPKRICKQPIRRRGRPPLRRSLTRGPLGRSGVGAPSRSTLRKWSVSGISISRALMAYNKRGRGKLVANRTQGRRIRQKTTTSSLLDTSSSSSNSELSADAEDEDEDDDEDDNSSVTVAAAQDEDEAAHPKTEDVPSVEQFDPENDECPTLATITEENRSLFADIQADVQACLPQPLESSLALPPANNPKLLAAIASPAQSRSESHKSNRPHDVGKQHLNLPSTPVEKPEDTRFPPRIQLGRYIITTWYSAPYPSEYARLNLLYICEFCLKYAKTRKVYMRHIEKCPFSFPPGNEIYRSGNVSVFEVDGYTSRLYCQQLCLLAKLFLDHKTLYYDVEPFLFYVIALREEDCFHLVGYFSKEKRSAQKYNLSCIMVLPPYQKHAYGRFLIDFSFLLSRIEGQPGSPEKPLSELGRLSYESYWRSKVLPFILELVDGEFHQCNSVTPGAAPLVNGDGPVKPAEAMGFSECVVTIHQISVTTGIDPHDVADTIQQLATSIQLGEDGRPLICFDKEKLLKLKAKYDERSPHWIKVDEECLRWSPLINPHEMDASGETGHDSSECLSSDSSSSAAHEENLAVPNMKQSPNPEPCKSTPGMSNARRARRLTSQDKSTPHSPVMNSKQTQELTVNVERKRSLRSSVVSENPQPSAPFAMEEESLDRSATEPVGTQTRRRRSSALRSLSPVTCMPNGSLPSDGLPLTSVAPSKLVQSTLVPKKEPDSRVSSTIVSEAGHLTHPTAASVIVNGTLDNASVRRRTPGRPKKKIPKRVYPSPCRKKSFFRNGSSPPGPPSPHGTSNGGRGTSGTLTLTLRTTRLRSDGHQTSTPTTTKDNGATKHMDKSSQDPVGETSEKTLQPHDFNSSTNIHLYSRENGMGSAFSLHPSYSSSPRSSALSTNGLAGQPREHPKSSVSSPCLPPPLSPLPPALSLLDGVPETDGDSSAIGGSTIVARCPFSSFRNISINVPPCLSLYESVCHPVSTEEVVLPPTSPISLKGVSTKESYHSSQSRQRRYTHPSGSHIPGDNNKLKLIVRPTCQLISDRNDTLVPHGASDGIYSSSPASAHSESSSGASDATECARIQLDASPMPSESPTGSQKSLRLSARSHASLGEETTGRSERQAWDSVGIKSCPSSPSDMNGSSFIPSCEVRRSTSMSILQEALDEAELPPVTRHSPSHSPPLLPPPVLSCTLKDMSRSLSMSTSLPSGIRNDYETMLHPKSPSPPQLITVVPNHMTGNQSTPPTFTVRDVPMIFPPFLLPSSPTTPATPPLVAKPCERDLLNILCSSSTESMNSTIVRDCQQAGEDSDDHSSVMTIPMHAQGLLSLNMTPNSALDDMSSQSSTLSFISSSPASRHSSQETVAMRLLSPSPPPLGKDASIESLNSAPLSADLNISSLHCLRYSNESANNEQTRRRLRHTSEPVVQPILDSGGPLLRRREQSFNSLSDYLGEVCDKEAVPLDVITIQPMTAVEGMKSQELLYPTLSQLQTLPEHSELIGELASTNSQIHSEAQFESPIKAHIVKIELGLALITDHLCCESTQPLHADTQPVRATVTTVPFTARFVAESHQVEVHTNTRVTHSAHQSPSAQVCCDDAVVEQIRLDLKNSFEDSTSPPSAKSLYGHDDIKSSGCGDVPLKSCVCDVDSCDLFSPVVDARTQLHVKLPPSKLSPDEFLRPHSSFILPPNETPSAYSSPGSLSFLPNRPNRRQTVSAQNTLKKNQLKFPSFARSQTRARQSLSFSFDRSTSVPGICISKTGVECRRTDDINSSCVYSSLNLSPYSYTEAPSTPQVGAPAHSPASNRCSSVGQLKFTRSPRRVQNELTQIIEQRSSIFAFTPESDKPDAEVDEELSGSSDFVSPDVNHLVSSSSPSPYQGSLMPSVSDNNHGCLFPLPTSPFDADYGRSTFTHVPSPSVPPQSTYMTPVTFHSPKSSVLDAPPGSTFSPILPPVSSQALSGTRKPPKSRQIKPNTLPRRQRRQAKSSVGDHSYVSYVTPSNLNPSTATSWIASQRMANSVLTATGTATASAALPVSPGGVVVVGAPTAFVQQHTNMASPVRAFPAHTLRPASAISVYDDTTRADNAFCINQSPYYNPAGTLTSDQELHDIHQFESYPSVQYGVLPPQTSEGGNLSYPVCPTDPHLPMNTTFLETSTIQPQTNFAFLSPNSSSIPQFVVQNQSSLIAPPQSSIPCSINSGVFSTLVPLGQPYGTTGPCEFLLEKSMHPLVGPDQPIYGQQQHCPQTECTVSPSPRISLSPPAAFTPTVCSLPTHGSTSIAHLPPLPSVSATNAFVNTPLNIISTGSSTCLGLSVSPTSNLHPPSGCYVTPISSLPDESQIDGCAGGIAPANNHSSAVRIPQQLSDCCQPPLMHFPTSTTPVGSSVVGSQQVVLCPQLIIYPPSEAGFPDLTPIPSSPVTGGRMLTSVSGEYGKNQLPPHPFVYPLSSAVATPQSLGWPQAELIPSGHQLPPVAPIHHLMPT